MVNIGLLSQYTLRIFSQTLRFSVSNVFALKAEKPVSTTADIDKCRMPLIVLSALLTTATFTIIGLLIALCIKRKSPCMKGNKLIS